jgi:hypothetical protein
VAFNFTDFCYHILTSSRYHFASGTDLPHLYDGRKIQKPSERAALLPDARLVEGAGNCVERCFISQCFKLGDNTNGPEY